MTDTTIAQLLKELLSDHEKNIIAKLDNLVDDKIKLKVKPFEEHMDAMKQHVEDMKPLTTAIASGKFLLKLTLGVVGLLSAIGGLILIFKELFK